MIQSNELRIGNIVENIHSKRKVEIFEVLTTRILIKANPILRVTKSISTPLSGYKGIEITPEVLNKCGLSNHQPSAYWKIGKWFEIYDSEGVFTYDLFRGKKVELHYLHQLQNLYFALSGEELPVDELLK